MAATNATSASTAPDDGGTPAGAVHCAAGLLHADSLATGPPRTRSSHDGGLAAMPILRPIVPLKRRPWDRTAAQPVGKTALTAPVFVADAAGARP